MYGLRIILSSVRFCNVPLAFNNCSILVLVCLCEKSIPVPKLNLNSSFCVPLSFPRIEKSTPAGIVRFVVRVIAAASILLPACGIAANLANAIGFVLPICK